ncbi:hypothetical protein N4Q52_12815 [Enterobacter mori]|uniref:hypothetical protein n=1 Tax=Enterobacter mori TaxID=539813 RepID=UPI0021B142E7|nr:hypothetical protein [Enterobacter mori]MCT6664880.1 hypothetical protein [Enterobacter mori]
MRNVQAFRKKKFYITGILIVLGYGLWSSINSFLYLEQNIIYRQDVGAFSTLYITESSAGATTLNVYKFYLYNIHEAEAILLEDIKSGYEPFLVTTDPDVKVLVEENAIHLKVSGKIFKFSNVAGHSFIYLNSSPF